MRADKVGVSFSPPGLNGRAAFSWFFYVSALTFLSSLALGGATSGGHLSDVALQIIAIPLLIWSCWRLFEARRTAEIESALAFCCLLALIPLAQLIPLPPAVWSHFPGREVVVSSYGLLDRPLDWAPMSLSRESTWTSVTSLAPPFAIFCAALTLSWSERKVLCLLLLGFTLVSAFVGLLQVAQGQSSPLFLFEGGNDGSPVGFFMNRNHFAALLYSAAVFMTAWLMTRLYAIPATPLTRNVNIFVAVGLTLGLLVLIAVAILSRSRAGVLSLFVGIFGSAGMTMARRAVGGRRARHSAKSAPSSRFDVIAIGAFMVGIVIVAIVFVGGPSLIAFLDRFDVNVLVEARSVFGKVTFAAARALMPTGAGVGAFVPTYQLFEKAGDLFPYIYTNRAHNDLLENMLETGIIGPVALCIFLFWFAKRIGNEWRAPQGGAVGEADLRRAASIVVVLLLGHSLFDYPLRTAAIMSVAALACALLIKPAPVGSRGWIESKLQPG